VLQEQCDAAIVKANLKLSMIRNDYMKPFSALKLEARQDFDISDLKTYVCDLKAYKAF